MTLELRPVAEAEFAAYHDQASMVFSGRRADPGSLEIHRHNTELDRTLAAFDAGRIVATAAAYSFQVGLPGGLTAPAAGVTRVTVAPTHRRQGILRRLMRRQLDDVRERGEPLALLYASEGAIYGRFGYGVGTWHTESSIARSRSAFAGAEPVRPRVRLLEPEEARRVLPAVHERLVPAQPGMISRSSEWWDFLTADPPAFWRGAGGDRRYAVHDGPQGVDGFAIFRVEPAWDEGNPSGTVHLQLLLAESAPALSELWRFCLDIDLMATVKLSTRPLHDPLRLLLADPRALVAAVEDGVWARLVDLPAALAARRYATEDGIALEVEDEFCEWNSGRWELAAGPQGADCRPSSREPDLCLTADALASCYLGANRFFDLLSAGRAAGSPAAARRADAMFAAVPEAWCPTHF